MAFNPDRKYTILQWVLMVAALMYLTVPLMTTEASLTPEYRPGPNPVVGVESELIRNMLKNYSRFGRPIADVLKPVEVSISFYLTQLMSLEEKHQVLTTFGWLETYWNDDYLKWNYSDYSNLKQLVLSPELVWLPDFGIENSAKAIYDELFFKRFRVSVSYDGLVNWVPGGKFVTSCQLDITFYPFDDQVCHIDLVDWAYHGLQVKLVNGSAHVGLDAYTESGEWQIINTIAQSDDQFYESDPGVPFPRVRFSIFLRRKSMFYTINIITPCCTMSLLALLVFYLPPDSGEKVSLGITVLLSFSVFLLLVAENVPKTSEFVPLLGIYLTLIMAMTAMSILICVIVLNLHHRDPNSPVPTWLRRLTHRIMAPLVCMQSLTRNVKIVSNKSCNNVPMSATVYQMHDCSRTGYKMAMHADTTVFDGEYSDELNPGNHINSIGKPNSTSHADNGFNRGRSHADEEDTDNTTQKSPLLEEVVRHLRRMTAKMKEREDQEALKNDWKLAAKILDRFFLVLMTLFALVASVVLLLFYPMTCKYLNEDID